MKKRGFGAMTPDKHREAASKGGKASQKVRAFKKKQVYLPGFEPVAKQKRKLRVPDA